MQYHYIVGNVIRKKVISVNIHTLFVSLYKNNYLNTAEAENYVFKNVVLFHLFI